jgi:hypothetical protein
MVGKIEIVREFDFNELQGRLRNVSLRGFPDVKIYGPADISVRTFFPGEILRDIFTPQPTVYTPELEKIGELAQTFASKGINISTLRGGVDYLAEDDKGNVTEWTIIPPVIEMAPLFFQPGRGLDFQPFIGSELRRLMHDNDYRQNPELKTLNYEEYLALTEDSNTVPEICDGSHRIEFARKNGLEQTLLFIDGVTPGFPYYAVPKPYRDVHEEPLRDEDKLDKTHILTSPGHKQLYRIFPTGGINTGNLRPSKHQID